MSLHIIFFPSYQLSARFLKASKKIADLVGNEKMKASASVRHLALPCSHKARSQIIPDIIRCYSGLVFLIFISRLSIMFFLLLIII